MKTKTDFIFITAIVVIFLFALNVHGQTISTPYVTSTISSGTSTGRQVYIGTIPTILKSSNLNRRSILIRNQGATDMYIGGSWLTISNGTLLKINEVIVLDRSYSAWYGIVSAGSTTAAYIEE